MSATLKDTTVSQVFACRECGHGVTLAEEIGGDMVYACVNPSCGKCVHVNCPEALALREDADLAEAAWQMADDALRASCACYATGIEQDACVEADTCTVGGALGKRLAQARAKAAYHLAGGLEIRQAGGAYLVPSGTRGGVVHRVEAGRCSCEAGQAQKPCWHVAAVQQLVSGARRAA